MGGLLAFFVNQITFKPKPLPAGVRLDQQTAIITGSNVGIGLETARQLASHGVSRIILGVRDINKGNAAKDDLAKSTPKCDFQVWELHQDSHDSIIAFAEKAKSLDRLDIVLLNAGVKQLKWTISPGGHEENVQVNHLGTALLSVLLLPLLKSTSQQTEKPGRLTFTTSEVHFWTPFQEKTAPSILERMDQQDSFGDGMQRYNTSKLLGVLWFKELASKVDAKEVIINAPNPGLVASQFHRHDSSAGFKVLSRLLAWTPTQGAYFLTDAAVTKQAESHGAYIQEQKITPPSKFVLSAEGKEVQKKLWNETIALFQKEAPAAKIDSILP